MGIDVGAKLIFGWEVDYELLYKFFKDNAESDSACFEDYNTDVAGIIPKGIIIEEASPHFDAGQAYCNYFVSFSGSYDIASLNKIINNKEFMDKIKTFAYSLGGSGEPKLMAYPNVW